MEYFEIYGGEDGVQVHKIENIENYLNDLAEGNSEVLPDFPKCAWTKKRTKFDSYSCNCDKATRVLIKGTIVIPKKKEVVTKWEIE